MYNLKKLMIVGIMLLFVGMSILPSIGSREDITIFDTELSDDVDITLDVTKIVEECSIPTFDGNILYVGGSGSGNYSSIQAAINDAEWDDTVFVYDDSSPYYEHVIIDKRIQLIGEEKNTTIIDGGHIEDVVIIDEYVGRSVITGFTIQNGGNDYGDDAAIENRGGNNLIAGNIISNNDGIGIYCNGIDYECCGRNIISGNVFTHNGGGIFLDYSFDNEVYDNYVSNNGGGIYIGMSLLPQAKGNFPLDEFFNNVYRNTITNNTYGVCLHPSWYAYIYENNITNNKYGILIEVPHLCSCKHNYIYQNNIVNNQDGVLIWANFFGPAEDNYIYQNNFIGNVDHATDTGKNNKWDNGSGNYWDDYEGIDGDGDGIGDTPYEIPEQSNDRFPLMTAREMQSDLPNKPARPSGKSSGIPFVEYTYTTSTTDIEGDEVRYLFDWGDGITSWTDYYSSGETATASHEWTERGSFEIKVKAKDIYGYESEWSDPLSISMPVNQATHSLFLQFLEHFPRMFPIDSNSIIIGDVVIFYERIDRDGYLIFDVKNRFEYDIYNLFFDIRFVGGIPFFRANSETGAFVDHLPSGETIEVKSNDPIIKPKPIIEKPLFLGPYFLTIDDYRCMIFGLFTYLIIIAPI